jgi:LAS superfamily LD-carboxypeptidase LdcB
MSILRGVTKNLTSLRESVASSVSTAEGIINSVKKDNAAKRKNTANDNKLFRQRRNNILRQEREDALEASTVTGSLKRTGKVIQKSNKSFLGRIMDFVGTLLIGWAVTTLPRIIGSAEDVMKRGQLFIRNMEEFVKGIGDIITATTIGIMEVVGAAANFDFEKMGDSIQTAAQRVQLGFTRMQLSVDRAFQILSRPMSELIGVTEKDFELPEEEEEIQARQATSQPTSQQTQTQSQGEQREVNTGSVDTGYKDYKGRPIKLSPQAAKAFIKMAKDAEAEGITNFGSYITSHFRSEEKNEDVGGVRGSKHLTGNAIDIDMLNSGPGDEWIQKNGAKYGFIYNGYKPDSTHFDFDPTKVTVPLEPPKTKTPPPEPLTKVAPPPVEPKKEKNFIEKYLFDPSQPFNFDISKKPKTINVPYPVVASAPPVQKTASSSMMPSAGRLNNTLYDVQLNSPALT